MGKYMETHSESIMINEIPAILWGGKSDKIYLYVHGYQGSRTEAELFARLANARGWQVLSFDMPGHGIRPPCEYGLLPWEVAPDLQQVYGYIDGKYQHVALYCSSVGAYFSMLCYNEKPIEHALFVSPILDMELMIRNLMAETGVSEERLKREQIIPTSTGFLLIWRYLEYVVQRPIIRWNVPTKILYPGRDNFTDISVVDKFVKRFDAELEVFPQGEHWFHTKSQIEVLKNWIEKSLAAM